MSVRLAVALEGAGWHPAAWRDPAARPADLFRAGYWVDLVREAEAGLVDLVTFEDAPGVQSASLTGPDDRVDQVRGRVDAVLVAGAVAPHTSRVRLVPTVNITHTDPARVAEALTSLDRVSGGRAGWRPQISARAADADHFGRRTTPALSPQDVTHPDRIAARLRVLFEEGAGFVRAVRERWEGAFVTSLAHAAIPYEFAAKGAEITYVTPHSRVDVNRVLAEVRAAETAVGRTGPPLEVFADLLVFLDETPGAAEERKKRLDALDGAELASDALVFTGTAGELADLLIGWRELGLAGFRLRPGVLPLDLERITRDLVPELRRRGVYRDAC
ncbi:LLM class flavin-dependent oxidoreductase [Actinosynnema sp. NPDC020468]|uniref:LLM class flavin-dependent oxidoreductase n=1 Tax=Actinosynnema sp. NPDC020468 TaxID=3154488 RepID=UPI00340CE58F